VVNYTDINLKQLADEIAVQTDIDNNLQSLFKQFCQTNKLRFTLLPDNQLNLLSSKLIALSADEICAHICGVRDEFPALGMTAKQALQLLGSCLHYLQLQGIDVINSSSESKQHKYVHAIMSYVVDPWNIGKYSTINGYCGSILACYYISPIKPVTPTSYDKLYSMWNIFITNGCFNYDVDYTVCQCTICMCDINNKQPIIECCQCHQFYHVHCLDHTFKEGNIIRCPICRYSWDRGNQKYYNHDVGTDFHSYNVGY
jgi:hypothetical protein